MQSRTVTTFPLKKFCTWNLTFLVRCEVTSKRCGYLAFMSSSVSQVAPEEIRLAQITLTKGICLLWSYSTLRSSIWIGRSSYAKFKITLMSSVITAWSGSRTYFLSWDTWNRLCTSSRPISKSSRYATRFNFSMNSYGPIYHGLNLPHTPMSVYPLLVIPSKEFISYIKL